MSEVSIDDPVPAAALERRDEFDRLVALTWHGPGATAAPSGHGWLVAVDGSKCSLRALAAAGRLAAQGPNAELDLVHVLPWLVKEAAEIELPRRGWSATAQARQLLDATSIRWRLHVVMGEAAPEIAGLANALGCCGIAIGSRGLTAAESLLLGSVTRKVLYMAEAPVLIVR